MRPWVRSLEGHWTWWFTTVTPALKRDHSELHSEAQASPGFVRACFRKTVALERKTELWRPIGRQGMRWSVGYYLNIFPNALKEAVYDYLTRPWVFCSHIVCTEVWVSTQFPCKSTTTHRTAAWTCTRRRPSSSSRKGLWLKHCLAMEKEGERGRLKTSLKPKPTTAFIHSESWWHEIRG